MPWLAALLRPILGFRRRYLPLIMVYFAYGALGLIEVTRDMWIKESLRLSPSELASMGVWLGLPWTVKMVFGQLVDSVPIFGSQRRSYVLIGAALTACGMLVLATAAAGMLQLAPPEQVYLLGSLLIVIGTLAQDVVADAMSTEVVPRIDEPEIRAPNTTSALNSASCRCSAASRYRSASSRSPARRAGSRASSADQPFFCSASRSRRFRSLASF